MDTNELWSNFELSGKIEDYLKYKMENEGSNETIQSERDSNKGNTTQGK